MASSCPAEEANSTRAQQAMQDIQTLSSGEGMWVSTTVRCRRRSALWLDWRRDAYSASCELTLQSVAATKPAMWIWLVRGPTRGQLGRVAVSEGDARNGQLSG